MGWQQLLQCLVGCEALGAGLGSGDVEEGKQECSFAAERQEVIIRLP